MPSADIAVVIPAHDAEAWIGDTLRSVLEQDPYPAELIVVDDGSGDSTAEVAKGVSGDVVVVSQHNRGPGAARNAGAAHSSGEWLLFLDADDLLLPGALRTLAGFTAARPDATVVNPTFRLLSTGKAQKTRSSYDRRDLWRVIARNQLSGNAMMRRETWSRFPYPEHLSTCEDLLLWLSLLLGSHRIDRTPQPVIARRHGHPGAATGDLMAMRRCRRLVFEHLRWDPRLSLMERTLLDYQLTRTSVGALAAAARLDTRHEEEVLTELRRSRSVFPRAVASVGSSRLARSALRRLH